MFCLNKNFLQLVLMVTRYWLKRYLRVVKLFTQGNLRLQHGYVHGNRRAAPHQNIIVIYLSQRNGDTNPNNRNLMMVELFGFCRSSAVIGACIACGRMGERAEACVSAHVCGISERTRTGTRTVCGHTGGNESAHTCTYTR